VLLGTPPDESRFKAVSLSVGGRLKFELIDKHCWLIPEIDLICGRTWNEHQYNSIISMIFYKPALDGILFNWKVDTLTYAPALQLTFEYPITAVTLGLDTKFTYVDKDERWLLYIQDYHACR
jgi:hypothetical protein